MLAAGAGIIFRQMGDKHKENYPHSSEHKEIEVKIKKLDDVINPELIKKYSS